MARVEYGSTITALKGSIGGTTYHRNPSGNIARLRPLMLSKTSSNQILAQINFSIFRSAWGLLTSVVQGLWNTFAAAHTRTNYFNEVKTLTGYNWYLSININAYLCGQSIINSPPAYTVPANPPTFFLIISPTNIFIVFTTVYSYTTAFLFAFLTYPVRSQSLLNRSKLRLITVFSPSGASELNVAIDYKTFFKLSSLPSSPDGSGRILSSVAAISNSSFIASAFSSAIGEMPPTTLAAITTGFDGLVYYHAYQSDGKVICVGNFTHYNGTVRNRIARLNANMSLDTTFTPGTGFANNPHFCAVDGNGKIIVVGVFTTYQGSSFNHIVRLNTDASIDNTFVVGTGFNDTAYCILVTPANKYFIGGNFTTYKGTSAKQMCLLNNTGSLDASFLATVGFNSYVHRIIYANASELFVSGAFTTYGIDTCQHVALIADDGTFDPGFDSASGFNANVYAIALDQNGKLYCVGNFTTYKGVAANYIIRLLDTGTKDTAFNNTTGFNAQALSILVDSHNFPLIVGDFTTWKGANQYSIARLRPTGEIDSSLFNFTTGTNKIRTVAIDQYSNILVTGDFTALGAITINRIARLYADGTSNM